MRRRDIGRRLALSASCASLVLVSVASSAQSGVGSSTTSAMVAPANDRPTVYGQTYGKPFIDVDEWRESPRRHRYIHGGFEDSHLRFSLYLPPRELYKERFLAILEGGAGGLDKMMTVPGYEWAFDVAFDDLGAYLVETNEGHWPDEGLGVDNAEHLWQASGYALSYARNIAQQAYGTKPRRGYITGCSGGGARSSQHLENLPDLIDGSVSEAWGHLGGMQWPAYSLAGALLGDKMEDVKDAMEVGGSGNPYQGLDPMQAEAVRDWLAMGMSRDGVIQWKKEGWFAAPFIMYSVRDSDPTYFEDFWTKPGYVGHDDPQSIEKLILDTEVSVERLLTVREMQAMPGGQRSSTDVASYGPDRGNVLDRKQAAIIKYDGPKQKLNQVMVTILNGKDRDKTLQIMNVMNVPGAPNTYMLLPFVARGPHAFDNVQPGDKIRISNRDYVAWMFSYRHGGKVISESLGMQGSNDQAFPEFRTVMDGKGRSKYVQRSYKWAEPQSSRFKGKLIALSGSADEPIWPTSMTIYERRLRKNLGANASNQFRLWWVDDHPHCGGQLEGPMSSRMVPSRGITQQALRDVVAWAEKGTPPASDTSYSLSSENALILPPTARERGGIQPVAKLSVDGKDRIEVAVGAPVRFVASAAVPPGGGSLVKAQFDFDGQGKWPEMVSGISGSSPTINATATHTYDKPGTYFAAFRVGSHREGASGKGELIYDLARVRVVVK